MMSVTPGIGSGINDESTIDTKNNPTSPNEKRRWMSRLEARGEPAASIERNLRAQPFSVREATDTMRV
jgi:hypothetical protein